MSGGSAVKPVPPVETIQIVVNGEPRVAQRGQTLLALVESLGIAPDRVAIEMDRRIVKRPEWGVTRLNGGASIEIVQFVGGG